MASLTSKKKRKWKKTKPYNSPKPEDLKVVVGSWKITKVLYESYGKGHLVTGGRFPGRRYHHSLDDADSDVLYHQVPRPDYQGVEVVFDDQCDVAWTLPEGVDTIPLFQTTSFNIDGESLDLIGGVQGRTFHFQVECGEKVDELCLKTPLDDGSESDDSNDERESGGATNNQEEIGDMIIVLDKMKVSCDVEEGFTLRDALQEGYFSDLVVTSTDGQPFNVHCTILACCSSQMTLREWEMFLPTLKAQHLSALLNYIYSGSLPSGATVSLVRELMSTVSANPKLTHLVNVCQAFIGSYDLKQRLLQLIDDIQSSIELGKKLVGNVEVTNPVKVTYTIKQLAKEAAVAITKLGLLCELYTHNKKEMKKSEKQEVLEYLRGRVVVIVDQLSELLDLALDKYHSLTEEHKEELATYIIPEVEHLWDMLNGACGDSQSALIAGVTSLTKRRRFNRQEMKLSVILQFVSHGGELKKLKRIGKEFAEFVFYSKRKREEFEGLSESDKVEKIIRGMSALKREGVGLMKELRETKEEILLHNALDWKKFKILVAVCCSYVTWGLRKLQVFKAPLTPVLLKACRFIQRSEVNDALMYFNLLEAKDLKKICDNDDDEDTEREESEGVAKSPIPSVELLQNKSSSHLATGCLRLLTTLEYSDMQFVLQQNQATPPRWEEAERTTPTEGEAPPTQAVKPNRNEEPVIVSAHRVIVSARCEWLKRALTCGMREAIDRRITIHGCDVTVFLTFLKYLYSGNLETESMSLDDVIEVLAVADQYETTSLRSLCEGVLVSRVEDSNVFFLLQVADRFSARKLREATLQHIIDNHEVIMLEVDAYSSLPDELKEELRSVLSTNDPSLLLRHGYRKEVGKTPSTSSSSRHNTEGGLYDSGSSTSLDDTAVTMATQKGADDREWGEYKFDEEFHDSDTVQFQSALEQLKGIVGSEANEELLRDFLLAADMDVNRAANYYLNTQLGD